MTLVHIPGHAGIPQKEHVNLPVDFHSGQDLPTIFSAPLQTTLSKLLLLEPFLSKTQQLPPYAQLSSRLPSQNDLRPHMFPDNSTQTHSHWIGYCQICKAGPGPGTPFHSMISYLNSIPAGTVTGSTFSKLVWSFAHSMTTKYACMVFSLAPWCK